MSDDFVPQMLSCKHCGHESVCGLGEMAHWLVNHGKLKRNKEPDAELLVELFQVSVNQFACPDCGEIGLAACRTDVLDDTAWGMVRACEFCGKPIPRERLEIFPDTTTCMACKQGEENNGPVEEFSFCPKCGAAMTQEISGRGITRYQYRCSECRYRD